MNKEFIVAGTRVLNKLMTRYYPVDTISVEFENEDELIKFISDYSLAFARTLFRDIHYCRIIIYKEFEHYWIDYGSWSNFLIFKAK